MKKQIIACIILLIALSYQTSVSNAQNNNNSKYGLYVGLNDNLHTANFQKLPGIPSCCPRYEDGSKFSYSLGLLYELKLDDKFWLGFRLGIMDLSATLTKVESTTLIKDGKDIIGKFEHNVISDIINLGLEPTLNYNFWDSFFLSGGIRIGMNIKKDYRQYEKAIEPEGEVIFKDTQSPIRNEFSGEIPSAKAFQMSALVALSYELPLNADASLRIAPEIGYYLGLTDQAEDTDWKINALKFGFALKYVPIDKAPKQIKYEQLRYIDTIKIENEQVAANRFSVGKSKIDTLVNETEIEIINSIVTTRTDTVFVKKEYSLSIDIKAVGLTNDGKEIENPTFTVEEFVSRQLDPILNYVFFDDNSSTIPNRYKSLSSGETQSFDEKGLYGQSTINIYYNVLNIVGKRMKDNPKAKITLVGCNSDLDNEKGNTELSQKRAESVKNYLVNNWNIEDSRIKIEKRNLPLNPSTPKDEPDKIAENRRVEINSDNYKILEPILTENIERTANPPSVRFYPTIKAESGIKQWQITASQNTDSKNKFSKTGSGEMPKFIDWKLDGQQDITPKTAEPLNYTFEAIDTKSNKKTAENKTLPFKLITVQNKRIEKVEDTEIEKYSLILFDFDKATIEGNNKKIIELIDSKIRPNSEVEIIGYTDRTGSEEYNLTLSEKRASALKNALNKQNIKSEGKGNKVLLFDNNNPEGRFYSRTVVITIKTKVK